MRVLQVVDGVGWSGTKEQVYLTTRELAKRGVEVGIALAFQYQKMVEKLKPYPVKVHYFEHHRGSKSRFFPANWWRLKRIIEEFDYDVVVGNSAHAIDFIRFTLPFLKKKPKLVFVRRNRGVSSPFSKWFKYSVADRIVVVSKKVYDQLVEADFFPEKLVVIESGVDLSRFKPYRHLQRELRKKLGIPTEGKVFVNVANWILHHKRQDLLLRAFARVAKRHPDAYLLLVGIDTDGPEARRMIERLGLKGRVWGLGFREDVPDVLNAADYFAFSSDFEGIAGALLQAMATEMVVISTAAGGIPEYLTDGVNGFLVPVGDEEALAAAMERALRLSPQEYRRLAVRARETAQNYSIERTAEKYIKLFEELVAK
ncbi:MAG: glycosyltransferase [Aquificae bacterium]|nr:glycosyltransferase [Aquificota bacterium]